MVVWEDVSIGKRLNLSFGHKPEEKERSTNLLSKFLAAAMGDGVNSAKTHLISLHSLVWFLSVLK